MIIQITFEFEKNSEYICLINESSRGRHGTEIIFRVRFIFRSVSE